MSESNPIQKSQTLQIEKLLDLSRERCRNNPQEGIKIAEEVISMSDAINSSKHRAQAIVCKGACMVWLGNYDLALEKLFEGLAILKDDNDEYLAHAYYHIFCSYYFLADYDNALKYAHDMLQNAIASRNLESQANAYNALGTIYYTTNEDEKAIETLTAGLTIAQSLNDKHLLARILDGIGTAYFNLQQLDKSIEYKKQSLEVSRSIGLRQIESYALDGLAKLYLEAEDYSNAEKYFFECLQMRKELDFKSGIAETNYQLGDLFQRLNKLDYSLNYLNEALKIAEETQTKEVIYKTHKSLYKVYEKQHNNTKFIQHFKSYYTLKEEFFSEKNRQKLKGLEMQVSISKIEKEKELLSQKNKQLEELSNNLVTLSNLGKKIISLLSIEQIIQTTYQILKDIMDSDGFGIGIYSKENNTLFFPVYIEKGEHLASLQMDLNDNNRLASVCFNKDVEVVINEFEKEVGKYVQHTYQPIAGQATQSIIYLPIKSGDKKLGVITLQSFTKNAFDDYKVNLAKNLVVYCAIAIENAQLYKDLELRVQERTKEVTYQKEQIEKAQETARLLNEIGKEIISTIDFDSILKTLHQKVEQLMNADCFGVRIYSEKTQEIHYRYEIEKGELQEPVTVTMSDDNNYSVWCVKNKKEIFINDNLTEYHQYTKKIVVPTGDMPSSLLFCPLSIGNRVIGVITVQSFNKHVYTRQHLDMLKTLSTYTAIALENASHVETLEEKVKERTTEVIEQKEQLELSFKNSKLLGEIGKEISSSLLVDDIISTVYNQVNALMDATIFGIGIHRPEHNDLFFSGAVEKGKKLGTFSFDLSEEKTATLCFLKNKEFVINDWENEYHQYVPKNYTPIQGEKPESLIYMPLVSKGKTIGVMSVQSFTKHIYTEHHVDLLRSLSIYVGGALENASLYKGMEERTIEVVKQKEIIEETNKHITDSIRYAKRIQEAFLPTTHDINQSLGESFVLFKPKDIVSGDFYWLEKKENKVLLAVADCTGHGVPGAFMSIIGFNGLNQVVNEYNITNPAKILTRLNKVITNTLKQKVEDSKIRDGMDITLCSIDFSTLKIEFAGAYNPLFIVRNGELIKIKGDKHPIGNFLGEEDFEFTHHEFQLQKGDKFYLFSDGFIDQFGGTKGKKLKYVAFNELLLSTYSKSMIEQQASIESFFEKWKQGFEQIDDVCIIGVAV